MGTSVCGRLHCCRYGGCHRCRQTASGSLTEGTLVVDDETDPNTPPGVLNGIDCKISP